MPSDLEDLQQKIRAIQGADPAGLQKSTAKDDNDKNGMHAGFELVGAIAAGGFIGYWLDTWLGTMPIFLILMFLLGVFTGFYNIYRLMNNLDNGPSISNLHRQQKDATKTPGSHKDSGSDWKTKRNP